MGFATRVSTDGDVTSMAKLVIVFCPSETIPGFRRLSVSQEMRSGLDYTKDLRGLALTLEITIEEFISD